MTLAEFIFMMAGLILSPILLILYAMYCDYRDGWKGKDEGDEYAERPRQ